MNKTTKFILGLIAVSLIGINVQMWNGKTGLIKPAYAYPISPDGSLGNVVWNVCYKGGDFKKESSWGFCN